jgi:Glyoxalase/Bleomycin resistance protein/Dioxygenase superfamily
VFALATDDCDRDLQALKARGVTFDGEPRRMPYGTGVTLNDLYGNKIYLNEDAHRES